MVRSIEGHGLVMTRYPPSLGLVGRPSLVTTSAAMPGNALVADPGLVGVAPGSGVMRIEPVSVCHQVSTIGQRLLPMTWWYHIQASGLMGSPTVPSSRRLLSSWRLGHSSPILSRARIAVGAV